MLYHSRGLGFFPVPDDLTLLPSGWSATRTCTARDGVGVDPV